jgi:hypothetical protein
MQWRGKKLIIIRKKMEIQKIIYDKMIAEKLSFSDMAEKLEPQPKVAQLRHFIAKFCKKNNLDMPKLKAGRKEKVLNLKIKSENS